MSKQQPQGQYQYVPISIAVPVFATVQAIPAPDKSIPGDLWGVIQNTHSFTIRQHLKLLPKNCCGCPPCVKQENTYSIYAGLTENSEAEIMRVDEVSDDWNRCCCAPFHPVRLEVRQYVPLPGDGSNSDYAHINRDMLNSWNTLAGGDQQTNALNVYKQYPPVMSFVRFGGQRCCYKCPCRVLDTFVCFQCCQDGFDVYAGALEDEPDKERGLPFNLEAHQSQMLGSVTQPIFGGCYHPQVDLRVGNQIRPHGVEDSVAPFAKLEGPCIFGGWSECCCDFHFPLSRYTSPTSKGDLGAMIKKKPTSLAGGLRSMLGDNSVYTMQFEPSAGLDAAQKSTVLAAELLYDYMLFDGATEKCDQDSENIYCYLCYCQILGALIPFTITIPKNGGN